VAIDEWDIEKNEAYRLALAGLQPYTQRQQQNFNATPRDALGLLATATMGVPVLGDAAGLLADANMYATQPESRGLLNYGLTLAGILPWMPSASVVRSAGAVGDAAIGSMSDPQFKAFFGGSKAITNKGEPLLLFHGTGEPRDIIKPGYDEPGAWFTTSYQNAGSYARGDNPIVHEAYLSIKNPLVVDFENAVQDGLIEIDGRLFDNNVDIVKYAERRGYDGVHFPVGNFSEDAETWVAFSEDQIKKIR
jgi:hypothetical protein